MFPSLPVVFNRLSKLTPPASRILHCCVWVVCVSCVLQQDATLILCPVCSSVANEGWHSCVHTWRRLMKDLFPWRWHPRLTKAAAGELDSPFTWRGAIAHEKAIPLMINSTQCDYSFKLFLHLLSNWLVRGLAQENIVMAITYLFLTGNAGHQH